MDLTLLRVRAHPAIGGKHIMLSLSESSSNTASTAAVPAPSVVTGMGSGVGEALETGVVESFASLSRLLESQPSDYAIARPRRPHFVPCTLIFLSLPEICVLFHHIVRCIC